MKILDRFDEDKDTVYISGPMTGKEGSNHKKFNEVHREIEKLGFNVINPVELNQLLDEELDGYDHFDFLKQDVEWISKHADGIVVFDDWYNSRGATDELYIANIIGLDLYEYKDGELTEDPELPTPFEAKLAVQGSRRSDYGHPADNLGHTAEIWNAVLQPKLKDGCEIDIRDVCMLMAVVKMSREYNTPGRDNIVDIIGYMYCYMLSLNELEDRGYNLTNLISEKMQQLFDNSTDGFDKHQKE